jgi:ABC-type lipoprotein release transport system permease subunit
MRGVSGVRGRLWGYYFDPFIGANYTLMVPATDAPAVGTVAVGAGLARSRGLDVGDILSLRSAAGAPYALKVLARLDPESELLSTDLILLSESDFRAFFAIPEGQFTDLVLEVRNPREVRTVRDKLVTALPDTRPILREEVLRTYEAVFGWRQGVVFVILLGAVLAFGILAWDKASGLSAEERREIGVLKAVGWETSDIIRMKLWEGALISLSAFLLGYLLAYLHVFYAGVVLFAPVLKGWAVLYPAFNPLPTVDGLQLATLFFFTVFPYTLATLIPIWRVATSDPDAVMR